MARYRRNIFLGNRVTILAIILILAMSFFLKLTVPLDSIKTPPEKIKYISHEYIYEETIKASPFKFARGKQGSEEGFRVLIMRKDKRTEVPVEVYIYNGGGEYLKYRAD
ncbi:hypothetical protein SDC9_67702 [bioreactor metagenome]|uniref:Uncharacterized protein n=1 Tax=bioreactor metagenome TaxID=1076179 RepID=A0A644XZQ0_9ZZZZ|nr:hypothetical protein [Lutispora sp.]MEA4961692.1 hypothetical protein [Lutispora sp.]